jgi:HK97 gp10 family phage protein
MPGGNKYRSRNLGLLARRFAPFRQKAVVALEFGLDILAFGMRARAPRRKTRRRKGEVPMYQSIRVTKIQNDHKRHRLYGRAYVAKNYAKFVEYGTVHMRAQPFVRPTQQIDGPLAVRAMQQILLG